MNDIVEQLRDYGDGAPDSSAIAKTCLLAADEIERLRGDVDHWQQMSAQFEAALATARRDALEEAAKRCDDLAFCEECHDCYDDLVRSAPYRRAAKEIRALAEKGNQ